MAEAGAEKTYSGLERFMFFLTPILFTLVLVGVLLTLFSPDLRHRMLETANKVPLLERIVPDVPAQEGVLDETAIRTQNHAVKIAELEALLAEKESEIARLSGINDELDRTVAELRAEVEELTRAGEARQLTDEEYQARITELAAMFGQIAPGKAAPILESMTIEETVLIMDAMRPEIRVPIMEKMTPRTAAEVTVRLKDALPAKDRQIAALQSRLDEYASSPGEGAAGLDDNQAAETFRSMDAGSAAKLLIQVADLNPAKVIDILNAIDPQARADILAAMNDLSPKYTAQLVNKLVSR